MDELSDVVAPDERHHHDYQNLFNSFNIRKMSILDIEACESELVDNLLKHTVLALHWAIINSEMSLIWARLTSFSKKLLGVPDN